MNNKGEDIRLEELFRSRLENAEVIPSATTSKLIMRKVARKEFIRFNYSRFNIYYLGGLILAGMSALIILIGGKDTSVSDSLVNPVITGVVGTAPSSISDSAHNTAIVLNVNKENNRQTDQGNKNIPASSKGIQKITNRNSEQAIVQQAKVNDNLTSTGVVEKGVQQSYKLKGILMTYSIKMETNVVSGCAPLTVHFYNKSEGSDSCRWSMGDGTFSSDSNPIRVFEKDGEYTVSLKVWFPDGNVKYADRKITVHPKPVAAFEVNKELSLLNEGETYFSNYSVNAVSYKWDFGDGTHSELFEPSHRFTASSRNFISLTAISGYGCVDSVIKVTDHSSTDNYINFPNAFIPNSQGPTGGLYSSKSDEAAQIFHPSSSGVSEYRLRIFSKRGIIVFESRDLAVGWDGYLKGTLCEPGVYVWEVSGRYKNGRSFIKMGDVTLLKE